MKHSHITSLPPEIWQEITQYACTDGGYTGLSLALSCKYLNAQSSKVRFQSVSLYSTSALESFLAYSRSCAPSDKPAVRHLWLFLMQERPRYNDPVRHADSEAGPGKDWVERFADTTTELLALTAPTLRTLCLLQAARLPPVPLSIPLPHLIELTISGGMSALVPGLGERLPALRRLHLLPLLTDPRPPALHVVFREAPLTHLRISGILNSAEELPAPYAGAVAATLGFHSEEGLGFFLNAPADPAPLPHLQNIIVQTVKSDLGWSVEDPEEAAENEAETTALRHLATACEREKASVRLLVLQMEQEWYNVWDRLWDDWVQRMGGLGNGCWVESLEEEAAIQERFQTRSVAPP